MDVEKLIDLVTQEIVRRLNAGFGSDTVLLLDGCGRELLADGTHAVTDAGGADCGFVLMTAEYYRALTGTGAKPAAGAPPCCRAGCADVILTEKKLVHERDLREHNVRSGDVVRVSKKTIVTALANDYAKSVGAKIVRES